MESATGLDPNFGTYEEALAHVEGPPEIRKGDVDVDWVTVRHFCVAVEDGNPSYWDLEFAAEQWGGLIAPPAMLMVWAQKFPWSPAGPTESPSGLAVPLPGTAIVNIRNVTEFLLPVHVGDTITASDVIESISPLKKTAVGEGHFVTKRSVYTRQDGAIVAVERNTLLRYTPWPVEAE